MKIELQACKHSCQLGPTRGTRELVSRPPRATSAHRTSVLWWMLARTELKLTVINCCSTNECPSDSVVVLPGRCPDRYTYVHPLVPVVVSRSQLKLKAEVLNVQQFKLLTMIKDSELAKSSHVRNEVLTSSA